MMIYAPGVRLDVRIILSPVMNTWTMSTCNVVKYDFPVVKNSGRRRSFFFLRWTMSLFFINYPYISTSWLNLVIFFIKIILTFQSLAWIQISFLTLLHLSMNLSCHYQSQISQDLSRIWQNRHNYFLTFFTGPWLYYPRNIHVRTYRHHSLNFSIYFEY